jgi:hypothetical protein
MGKGWSFRKTKNDREARSSGAAKENAPRNRRYVLVEFADRLFLENRLIPWPNAGMPGGGWYLNSLCDPVPPVPHEGRQR